MYIKKFGIIKKKKLFHRGGSPFEVSAGLIFFFSQYFTKLFRPKERSRNVDGGKFFSSSRQISCAVISRNKNVKNKKKKNQKKKKKDDLLGTRVEGTGTILLGSRLVAISSSYQRDCAGFFGDGGGGDIATLLIYNANRYNSRVRDRCAGRKTFAPIRARPVGKTGEREREK